jgi:hypothetical protein
MFLQVSSSQNCIGIIFFSIKEALMPSINRQFSTNSDACKKAVKKATRTI